MHQVIIPNHHPPPTGILPGMVPHLNMLLESIGTRQAKSTSRRWACCSVRSNRAWMRGLGSGGCVVSGWFGLARCAVSSCQRWATYTIEGLPH